MKKQLQHSSFRDVYIRDCRGNCCKFHARITRGLLSRRGRESKSSILFFIERGGLDEKERHDATLFGVPSNFSKKFTGIETRKIARYILKTSLER